MTALVVLQFATLITLACLCSGLRQLDRTQTRILRLIEQVTAPAPAPSKPEDVSR